ncbi:hypothetical protein F0L74_09810 [Chitinophaga agrisoli]|uniref:Baseplate protein J-like domain-containing protein n=1 Tax=Chitinophaga agrisoli TaxID=2607653 RepID=A0A5B2VVR1_9BACT|nr:hypothetical protein [Chitinophaga agrisoli]KAA2242814.1 hypothetical protein F0L74_09810 [Chitinophaga agrisoli]
MMARQIAQIEQQILDAKAADPVLSPLLTSTSKRAIYRVWAYIVASSIAILEQLMDVFSAAIESTVAKAAPGSAPWLQAQIFNFQYSADVPQVVQLVNLAPQYPITDASLRIVTRCSVTTDLANSVIVKVAKSDPPEALASNELTALQSYVNTIGVAGVTYTVRSLSSDKLYLQAQVFYNGQYSDVIASNVIQAVNGFLSQLPFNGQMRVSDLEQAIRGVAGVTDVLLQNVQARADGVAFGSGTYLVLNNQVISRLWPTVAGYMVGETTSGQTLTDTLQFIPE